MDNIQQKFNANAIVPPHVANYVILMNKYLNLEPMLTQLSRHMASLGHNELTPWGRVTHIFISNLTIIGSDNGLSAGRRQTIIWNSDGLLSIRS